MPSALLIGSIDHCRARWESFEQSLNIKLKEISSNRSDFLSKCSSGEFDDVVAIYRSNQSNGFTGDFNKELISALPKSVKFICHNGAGYDNIDVNACSEKGIQVSATPIAVNSATADTALFLLLGALRQAYIPLTSIRSGHWRGPSFALGHDPQGKTLGILGMGGIGREVAKRAAAFDMRVIYHNRHKLPEEKEGGARYVGFEELLREADVVSLNLSLSKETRHILSREEFGKMKDGVVIINTARGPLIDEDALVEALESGKVGSVGLDVYEREPEVPGELLRNERVMLLPHIGTATWETQRKMEDLVLDNLERGVREGKLVTPVREQAK